MPTRTTLHTQNSTGGHGTGGFTTNSFTPSNDVLLVVIAFAVTETDGAMTGSDLTITDSAGLTWTSRAATSACPGWANGIRIWTAPVVSGASMTVTVDCGAYNVHTYRVEVYSYSNYSTSTPVGATATGTDDDGDGPASMTLSEAPLTSSEVISAVVVSMNGSGTYSAVPVSGGGWTELFDSLIEDSWMGCQTMVRSNSDSSSVQWDDLQNGTGPVIGATMAAIEVRDSSASAQAPVAVFIAPYLRRRALES